MIFLLSWNTWIWKVLASCTTIVYIYLPLDFDTDEETDQLLEKQYQGNQYVDIPELSQPPVNRSAQVIIVSLVYVCVWVVSLDESVDESVE